MAAATDLSFHPHGYAAVLCNDVLTALYLIRVKATPALQGLTTTGLLFYNAVLSLPLLTIALLLSRESAGMLAFTQYRSLGFRVSPQELEPRPCLHAMSGGAHMRLQAICSR